MYGSTNLSCWQTPSLRGVEPQRPSRKTGLWPHLLQLHLFQPPPSTLFVPESGLSRQVTVTYAKRSTYVYPQTGMVIWKMYSNCVLTWVIKHSLSTTPTFTFGLSLLRGRVGAWMWERLGKKVPYNDGNMQRIVLKENFKVGKPFLTPPLTFARSEPCTLSFDKSSTLIHFTTAAL